MKYIYKFLSGLLVEIFRILIVFSVLIVWTPVSILWHWELSPIVFEGETIWKQWSDVGWLYYFKKK